MMKLCPLVCLLSAFPTSLCSGQTKVLVIEGQPKADVQKSFGLVENSTSQADENHTKLQAKLDAGPAVYPFFIPGAAGAYDQFHVDRTVVIPKTQNGMVLSGTGLGMLADLGPSGGGVFASQICLKASSFATTFDGSAKTATAMLAAPTVLVIPTDSTGFTVTDYDQWNSIEITGGMNFIAGWYGIESVDTEANTLTLDRDCVENGDGSGMTGAYCPTLMRNHSAAVTFRGINFNSRINTVDPGTGSIGLHIASNEASGGNVTGFNMIENCAFNRFDTGILFGRHMAEAYTQSNNNSWLGYDDDHADNTTVIKPWFGNCKSCVHVRNEQSLGLSFKDVRAFNLNGTVFRIDAGGKFKCDGLEINGSSGVQRILYLGDRCSDDNGPWNVSNFYFDGGTHSESPQLLKTTNTDSTGTVTFRDGKIHGNPSAYTLPILDVTGGYKVVLDNVARIPLAIDSAKILLTKGSTDNSGYDPHLVVMNCQLGRSFNEGDNADPNEPHDIIDLDHSDADLIIDFRNNTTINNGQAFVDGRFVTDGNGGGVWISGGPADGGELTIGTIDEFTEAIYATCRRHSMQPASGTADDLANIAGAHAGRRLTLSTADSGDAITVKDGSGNIECGGDRVLNNPQDRLVLESDGTDWFEISFVDNGA